MFRFTVETFINDGPGRFDPYEPGDLLTAGPVLAIDVNDGVHGPRTMDAMAADALDAAWVVGNKMGADAEGRDYDPMVRSLSVGDVLRVTPSQGSWPAHYYAVDTFGFLDITPADFARSTGPDALVNERGR